MSKKTPTGGTRNRQANKSTLSPLLIGGLALIAVAVLILVWFALGSNRGGGGSPQIRVSAERLELGKQIFDRPVRASFVVTNTGNGTLTLDVPRVATVLEGC